VSEAARMTKFICSPEHHSLLLITETLDHIGEIIL